MLESREEQPALPLEDLSDVELAGYLDELLPLERAAAVEAALRNSPALQQRLTALIRRRDQGGHTVGEIWRRQRLSCPSRSELGGFVLGILEPEFADYVRFHVHTIGCRLCEANLTDLQQAARSDEQQTATRRQRYFESSAPGLGRSGAGTTAAESAVPRKS